MTNTHTSELKVAAVDNEQLLTRRLLRKLVPVSDMTIWRWERDGRFPRHLNINSRNYWLLGEVRAWLADLKRGQVSLKDGGDRHVA